MTLAGPGVRGFQQLFPQSEEDFVGKHCRSRPRVPVTILLLPYSVEFVIDDVALAFSFSDKNSYFTVLISKLVSTMGCLNMRKDNSCHLMKS